MKLLFCPECEDVVRLITAKERKCKCKRTGGRYTNGLDAVYWGVGVPVGFDNFDFMSAVANQPARGWGKKFEAFVIPKECATFVKVDKPAPTKTDS